MSPTVQEIEVKSALTPTGGFLKGISHTLNPYGGCAFACDYCYVRELPVARYSPLADQGWGAWVRPKVNLPELLRAELDRAAARGKLDRLRIFMSSATDPYQPLERRYELTRRCLAILAERPPGWLIVQTRGPLVVRDLALLQALGRRAMVSITVETDDEAVRRAISPRAPALHRRHEAMAHLRAAGIYVQAAVRRCCRATRSAWPSSWIRCAIARWSIRMWRATARRASAPAGWAFPNATVNWAGAIGAAPRRQSRSSRRSKRAWAPGAWCGARPASSSRRPAMGSRRSRFPSASE